MISASHILRAGPQPGRRRFKSRAVAMAAGLCLCGLAGAQSLLEPPTYTLVEALKKTYGRASQDFRGIGCIDYWFIGHDPADGPSKCRLGDPVTYGRAVFNLPKEAVDGSNMDRHECGFLHLNDDSLIDMVCALGADHGTGTGPNEVYRNDSTSINFRLTRIQQATGIEDLNGRTRTMEPFKWANGDLGVWTTVFGDYRADGLPNINRLFRYDGSGSFHFTEVPDSLVNITTRSQCARVGDLNGDGLDDLLLCRETNAGGVTPSPSILLYQQSDESWRQATLPMVMKRWMTAEIHDMNGDGRQDLIISVSDSTAPRIEIYFQQADGKLLAEPSWSAPVGVKANSIAVGDLDGDARPDLYVVQSLTTQCNADGKATGVLTDLWPDVVFYSGGAAEGWSRLDLVDEPRANGCSWLATAAEPGVIHLGRGIEAWAGDNYVLRFKPIPPAAAHR